VAEETFSFGVRSGFQTYSNLLPKTFSKLFQTLWKNILWKKIVQPLVYLWVEAVLELLWLVVEITSGTHHSTG
jgi:hypothetical protein